MDARIVADLRFTRWRSRGIQVTKLIRLLPALESEHCPTSLCIFLSPFQSKTHFRQNPQLQPSPSALVFPSHTPISIPHINCSAPAGNEIIRVHMETECMFHYILEPDRRWNWLCEHVGVVLMWLSLCVGLRSLEV